LQFICQGQTDFHPLDIKKIMVVATKQSRRNEILQQIWATVPVGSPEPTDPETLARLTELTENLIDVSDRERLKTHPFQEVIDRRISFYQDKVESILKNKVVLITGGAGFVGGHLISNLQNLGVKKIISLDVANEENVCCHDKHNAQNVPCIHYHTDVRDYSVLQEIFELEQPDIVFHLAAQRLPGLAETQIYQTVSTNILGSENIIRACEEFGVESCIFSSTGKASRYYTPDIYAGSKKIAEWLFSDRLDEKNCLYGIVRFTHVVENSPISLELDKRVEQGLVSLHAPDRFTYAQNVTEAVHLLLNSLTLLERGKAKIVAVTNLGWPVNTLDIALHKIICAGGNIPIYFKGVPKGYETSMFMGQLDLSGEREIIPMLNVLEVQNSQLSPVKDMVIAELHPYSSQLLDGCMQQIKDAMVAADLAIREALSNGVKQMAISSFRLANPHNILNILGWGIDPEQLAQPDVDLAYFHEFAELLLAGLDRRLEQIDRATVSEQTLAAINYLQKVPSTSLIATYAHIKLMPVNNADKPKVLVFSTVSPLPLDRGDRIRLFQTVKNLSEIAHVRLLHIDREWESTNIDYQTYLPNVEIRSVKLSLQDVIVQSLKTAVQLRPNLVYRFITAKVEAAFQEQVAEFQPDLFWGNQIHSYPLFKYLGDTKKIVDIIDSVTSFYDLADRHQKVSLKQRILNGIQFNLAGFEKKTIEDSDRAIVCSHPNVHHLKNLHGKMKNLSIVYTQIVDDILSADTSWSFNNSQPFRLLFVGHLGYVPNYLAVKYIAQEILPVLRTKLDNFECVICGKGNEKIKAELGEIPNLTFKGFVDDLVAEYAHANVLLSPVPYATGVQNKVIEAMSIGLPVIVSEPTAIANEMKHDIDVLACNTPTEFAEAIVKVCHDRALAEQLSHSAKKLVKTRHHQQVQRDTIERIVTETLAAHHTPAIMDDIEPSWELSTAM
jgi:nucleoside-diphosphate-sugar epimerase/glycosyltransferase involved in cell wall biosynthesis